MDALYHPSDSLLAASAVTSRHRRARAWIAAAITLLIGSCATIAAWHVSGVREDAAERVQFQFAADNLVNEITDRFDTNVQTLWGAAGLLAASPSIDREQWRIYVATLQSAQRLSGTRSLGYARRVTASEKDAHISEMRRQGFADYSIWPPSEREELVAVTYLEPFNERTRHVIGYDAASEPERRLALEQARDSGMPTLSSRLELLNQPHIGPGFILFLPVYRHAVPVATSAERRAALIGYVYTAFRAQDFVLSRAVTQQAANARMALEIYDGPQMRERDLLFRSADFPTGAMQHRAVMTIAETVGGRTWLFRIAAIEPLAANLRRHMPVLILSAGLLISLLASAVVGSLALNRAQAIDANERLRADMARRERVEEQLRQSEGKFRQLFDNIPLPTFAIDRETLRYIEVNEAAVAKYGYSHDEFAQMDITEARPPEDVPHMLAYMDSVRDQTSYSGEFRHKTKQGRIIDVEITAHNIELDGRQATIVLANDITARNAAQRALAESEQQLRQAQKLETIGQLTGGIAHDFNNILTVITGTIEILADGVAHDPTLAAIAKLIDDAAHRGADLTRDLLAFARRQPLRPRETDINALVIGAAKLFRSTLGEQIEIVPKLDPELRPAFIDSSQLTTALLNLALNARDAMPNGGVLTLETSNVHWDEGYSRFDEAASAGPYVLITVGDTGAGIPEAIRDKVFELFFTTKEVGKGTGLGLSMVYGFVKQSGGHLKIDSDQGRGTLIRLYLPQADSEPPRETPDTSLQVQRGTEAILVVEDDDLVRTYVTGQLRTLGYVAHVAANAEQALAMIDHGLEFDLLFTDIVMPGALDGRGLAAEVLKRKPSARILFTSGYTDEAPLQSIQRRPGSVLLNKPYRTVELANKMRGTCASCTRQMSDDGKLVLCCLSAGEESRGLPGEMPMTLSRRHVMAAAGAAAVTAAAPRAFAQWQPSARYPDPSVKLLDPSFGKYRLGLASVERIAQGMRWCEGPVWFGDGRFLLWSDIPNNRIMKWEEETGRTSVFRKPSNFANGNTRDRKGRLVTCEHDTRCVSRTEHDGAIVTVADRFEGKPLNSPNDVVVRSDDSIWFTDPPFGILGNYEGHTATPELPTNVYRVDGKSGQITVVAGDINRPNGLAFSPDESKLYVVEAAVTPRVIQVFDVVDDGTKLTNKRPFLTAEPGGTPDGFRVDVDGNLWVGWGMGNPEQDGVKIFNPEGKPIGFIALPERCANVCFGGVKRNRLFMAASHSVYSLYVNTQGLKGG